jgi:hypothetical protein
MGRHIIGQTSQVDRVGLEMLMAKEVLHDFSILEV